MAEPATRSARSLAATRETVIRPPVFSPGSLGPALRGLLEHRDLLYTLSLHRIRVRYKQSLLGIGWAVVQPLATMVVLTVVFAYITRVPTGTVPYAVFALAGLVPWTCFANGLTAATHSLVSHAQLVTKVYFPREILPLTYVIAAVTDAAIAAAALLGLMAWYTVPIAPRIGLVVITAATLIALVTALALVLSAMQVRMRDVGVAMPIALQLLMFASPVAYPLDTVPARLHAVYILNPLVGIVENFRRAALDTGPTDVESLQVSIVWAVVLLPIAYVWFKRVDATAADVV
jgi:lipopolysaccharide transport system permease protein